MYFSWNSSDLHFSLGLGLSLVCETGGICLKKKNSSTACKKGTLEMDFSVSANIENIFFASYF